MVNSRVEAAMLANLKYLIERVDKRVGHAADRVGLSRLVRRHGEQDVIGLEVVARAVADFVRRAETRERSIVTCCHLTREELKGRVEFERGIFENIGQIAVQLFGKLLEREHVAIESVAEYGLDHDASLRFDCLLQQIESFVHLQKEMKLIRD